MYLFCQLLTFILAGLSCIFYFPFYASLSSMLSSAIYCEWLLGGTWVYPPAHQNISESIFPSTFHGLGFMQKSAEYPGQVGDWQATAGPSGSRIASQNSGMLCRGPAAEFIYRLALDPSDVMGETTELDGEDPALSVCLYCTFQ